MRDWPKSTLGEVVEFTNGGAWNQSEYSNAGVPVVRVSDIHDETVYLEDCKFLSPASLGKYRKHLLHEGDVVITTVGSHPTQPGSVVGRMARVPRSADGTLLNQNAVRLASVDSRMDQGYLRYLSVSQPFRDYIIAHARGSANQVRIAISALGKMPIALPPSNNQQTVASILSAYDNLIENNTRRIKILEEMTQMIYREWFVNFCFPDLEKTKIVESDIGLIPHKWKVSSLKALFPDRRRSVVMTGPFGSNLHASDYRDEGIPLILVKHVKNGRVLEHDLPLVGKEKCLELGRYILEAGDIIVTRVGFVGQSAYIHARQSGWLFSGQMLRVRLPQQHVVNARFLAQYFQSPAFKQRIGNRAVGTTRMSLNTDLLADIPLLIPDPVLQHDFEELVKPIDLTVEVLSQKNRILRQTRDLLCPKLISGQIEVGHVGAEAVAQHV